MKAAKKTMLMDGAKVAYTHGQYGKKVAEITFKNGGSITVTASFATLLDAKVKVAIKEHYSNVFDETMDNVFTASTIGQLVAFLNLCGLQSFTSTLKI